MQEEPLNGKESWLFIVVEVAKMSKVLLYESYIGYARFRNKMSWMPPLSHSAPLC
jgi:hypothetical protein